MSKDITEIEKELNEAKEKTQYALAAILSLLPTHVYWKDKHGVYLGCNDLQAKSLGANSSAEIIGKTDYELSSKILADKYRITDERIMRTGVSETAEEPALYNGKQAIFLSQKCPFLDSHNNVIGIIGVSLDITDRKKAEELQIKHEAAEKAVQFANMIAGSVAHELRTPLASIKAQIELLELTSASNKMSSLEKKSSCKNVISNVKNIIDGATYVIDDILLKLRSLSTGNLVVNKVKRVSIACDIENLLAIYPFREDERELVTFNDANGFEYFGNSALTINTLSNILKNALRAVKEANKGKITIILKTDDPSFNHLIFRDTALGIPKEFLHSIFDQFEAKTDSDCGTGLGLAFCKMVMQSYGGDITCDSKKGVYTAFTLAFPKIKRSTKPGVKRKIKV